MDKQIEIPLSKVKMTLLFIGALGFVAIGLWFMISPPESHSNRRILLSNPIFLFFIGAISVLFFGVCALFICKKLFDKKPGLIINEKGITDNSSALSLGLVLWVDIEGIKTVSANNQKFIILTLNNPQDYLGKVRNSLKAKSLKVNYKWYGSPICISANSLQINHQELHKLLLDKMAEFKSNR